MLLYLDSSAIVKLVRREPETSALLEFLRDYPERVSSVVASIEVPRAVRRSGATERTLDRAARVLDRIGLVELDAAIRARAAAFEPRSLRTLDAIHIATAITLDSEVPAFVTYDDRQAGAAQRAGIAVASPHS